MRLHDELSSEMKEGHTAVVATVESENWKTSSNFSDRLYRKQTTKPDERP